MSGTRDVQMGEGREYYQASESQYVGSDPNDRAPSWASSIIGLLTQLIRRQSNDNESDTKEQRPGHSQPHTVTFSGEDRSLYPQFRSLLEAKLRIDAKAIGNEEERVWYGYGRLTDTASRRIHPWIEYAKNTDNFTVAGFFDRLDKAFGDTEQITKAIDKLNTIRQGNRGFREFLQEFEQTILEAQGWGWDNVVKKGFLRAALNRELSDRLVSQVEPAIYDDFVSQLRTTADKMEVMKEWNNRKGRNRNMNFQPSNTPDNASRADQMDWEPTQSVNIAATMQNPNSRLQGPNSQRAIWVSHEEIGRRIADGSCIRCGRHGHRIRECSLLPALNPDRRGKGQSRNTKVLAASVPDSQDDSAVSENL